MLNLSGSNDAREIATGPSLERITGVLNDRTRPVVAVSSDTVAYLGKDLNVWTYSVSTGESRNTKLAGCLPEAWRTTSHQLVCRVGEDGKFLADKGFSLEDMRTGKSVHVNIPDDAHGLVYVSGCDELLYAHGVVSSGRRFWPTTSELDRAKFLGRRMSSIITELGCPR